MSYLTAFYRALPWQEIEPLSGDKSILSQVDGHLINSDSILAKADRSRSYVVIYVSAESSYLREGADVVVGGLCGGKYTARWYDPRTGKYFLITTDARPTGALREWIIPQRPDRQDWVLLLKADAPAQSPVCSSIR